MKGLYYVKENLVNIPHSLPYFLFLVKFKGFEFATHRYLEIIYVVRGRLFIETPRNKRFYEEGEFVIVNSHEAHSIYGEEDNIALGFQIDTDYIEELFFMSEKAKYDENMGNEAAKKQLVEALSLLSYTVWKLGTNHIENEFPALKKTLSVLVNHFQDMEEDEEDYPTGGVRDQIFAIASYISQHPKENITLRTMSEKFDISLSYLSRMFTRVTGIGMPEYARRARLKVAMECLDRTKTGVADVAKCSGFSNVKSMYRMFHSMLGMTPIEFRKRMQREEEDSQKETLKLVEELEVKNFLKHGKRAFIKDFEKTRKADEIYMLYEGNTRTVERPLNDSWKELLTLEMLGEDWLKNLAFIQPKLKFRYLRLPLSYKDGDYFIIYQNGVLQKATLRELGHIIMKIISHDIKLLVAIEPYERPGAFTRKSMASIVRDTKEYFNNFLDVMEEMVGLDEVLSWKFEFYLEGFMSDSNKVFHRYIAFYYELYQVLKERYHGKSVTWGIHIGAVEPDDLLGLSERCEYVRINGDLPKILGLELLIRRRGLNRTENYVEFMRLLQTNKNKLMDVMCSQLDVPDHKRPKLYFTKAYSLMEQPLPSVQIMDLYMATVILNGIEISWTQDIKGNCLAVLDETFKSIQPSNVHQFPPYWTGTLIDEQGVTTPLYYIYEFLNAMGTEILGLQKNCIMTKKGESYQILVYADLKYSLHETENRIDLWSEDQSGTVKVAVHNIEGSYRVTRRKISPDIGNSHYIWKLMGGIKDLKEDERAYLQYMARPSMELEEIIIDGLYEEFLNLKPFEIALIRLDPWDME